MALPKIIYRPRPTRFDGLRYWVPSHTKAGDKYLVDLEAYDFNSACQCKHFVCELEPLLRRGITPAKALAGGLVTLKPNKRPEDVLRCLHCVDAIMQFGIDAARLVHSHAQTLLTPQAKREAARET